MFIAIYTFNVLPGREADFRKGWRKMTELIYEHENSLGSRLHHAGGDLYVAYAQWPDRQTWEQAGGHLPASADDARKLMRESCSEISTSHELEMLDDLLKDTTFEGGQHS
jgi:heme-degrading monooxygenase HmoA